MKKFWGLVAVIVVCIISICSGIFCGVSWFKKVHAKSHIIGALDIDNSYTMDIFSYSNAKHPIAFSQDLENLNDYWYFREDVEKVPSFDGNKKQYEISLNNYLILDAMVMFRAVRFYLPMTFFEFDGSTLCEGTLEVVVRFYDDKTTFEIKTETEGNKLRQYFERYILANGFELFIKEVK